MTTRRTLVIYDSQFGNTKKIAQAMSDNYLVVSQATLSDVRAADLLIIGSPTQGGQPTKDISQFLQQLPKSLLKSKKVAAFDTRLEASRQGFGLKLLLKVIDYAAPKISNLMVEKGAILSAPPEGFYVIGKSGPVKPGELERAAAWSGKLV